MTCISCDWAEALAGPGQLFENHLGQPSAQLRAFRNRAGSICGFLSRFDIASRCAGRARLRPVLGSDLEGVDHLAHPIAMRDSALVDVFDEIANVGQGRSMAQVCCAVPILAREVDCVGRAASGTDAGWIGFGRCGSWCGIGLFDFRVHLLISKGRPHQYRAPFEGWHSACRMVLLATEGRMNVAQETVEPISTGPLESEPHERQGRGIAPSLRIAQVANGWVPVDRHSTSRRGCVSG